MALMMDLHPHLLAAIPGRLLVRTPAGALVCVVAHFMDVD